MWKVFPPKKRNKQKHIKKTSHVLYSCLLKWFSLSLCAWTWNNETWPPRPLLLFWEITTSMWYLWNLQQFENLLHRNSHVFPISSHHFWFTNETQSAYRRITTSNIGFSTHPRLQWTQLSALPNDKNMAPVFHLFLVWLLNNPQNHTRPY